MKVKKVLAIVVAVLLVAACSNLPKSTVQVESEPTVVVADRHTAENSLDYWGTYVGVLPAADCPGIEITLTLNKDKSYEQKSKYIGRDTYHYKGTYWVSGNVLTTVSTENDSIHYKVEENRIRLLDRQQQPIVSEFADMYMLLKK